MMNKDIEGRKAYYFNQTTNITVTGCRDLIFPCQKYEIHGAIFDGANNIMAHPNHTCGPPYSARGNRVLRISARISALIKLPGISWTKLMTTKLSVYTGEDRELVT